MSEFSYILSRHIHRKNIKTYALAQYCGLDRSNMYKIINGKRKPTSLEIVHKMSKFMHLSPVEKKELEEAYQITLAGYDNYFRRKDVMKFFNEFNLSIPSLLSFSYNTEEMDDREIILLNSSAETKQALFHIISTEMSRKQDAHIQLLIQPDASFLINLISAESQAGIDIHIEHIICLNNNSEITESQKNYNLSCLKQILPLYGSSRNYECFYYYDDITSKTGKITLFPYMIITSQYVYLLSSDFNKGIVMLSDISHKMFTEIFIEYRQTSTSLLNHIDSVTEQLNYVGNILREREPGYCFQMTPCFTPFITLSHSERYIIQNIPGRDQFITHFQEYIKEIAASYEQGYMFCIFSLEGVRHFLKSGKIDEYPPDVYLPFEEHDRIYFVKKLIQACKYMRYRMIRKNIGDPEHGLYLFVNQKNGYLMFSSPYNGQPVYLNIEEPGLLFTFYDFCENLTDEMFYTYEETAALLNNLIET